MKAIVQDVYGSADVLELQDVPQPVPGDGEVLIRVRAAGVDHGVWHLMTGRPYLIRLFGFGLTRPKVRVRGREVAGVVEAVGARVTRFQIGDEVFGTCDGSFAEFACAKEDKVVRKPEKASFEEAAAAPISGVTALQGLRDSGKVRAGQKVLVIGAGGGVGSYAVQLAKSFGAEVTGVCSTAKVELVRRLGADHTIDYTAEDFARSGVLYDLILDAAGNRPLSALRRALTATGRLVIVGGEAGGKLTGGFERSLGAPLASLFSGRKLMSLVSTENYRDLESLAAKIDDGSVKPAVDKLFPLAEAPAAIDFMREGRAQGKVVVRI